MSFVKQVTQKETLKLTSRFGAIELRINCGALATPVLMGNARTAINGITLEVQKQGNSGQQTIIAKSSLFDLAVLLGSGKLLSRMIGNNYYVSVMLPIADGSISFATGDEYHLFFDGAFGGYTIDLYSLDSPVKSDVFNFVERISVKANAAIDVIIADAQELMIPRADIQKIELLYSNGERLTYEEEEIASICRVSDGQIAIDMGKSVTFEESPILAFGVNSVYSVKITTDSDTIVTKLSKRQIKVLNQ